MRVGGVRRLVLPPALAYGDKGVDEVPGNAAVDVEVELLSIKTSARGYQVKAGEGRPEQLHAVPSRQLGRWRR